MNTIKLKTPPITLETAAKPKSSSRLTILGHRVTIKSSCHNAGGAPGALIKIAVIEPPKVPAQYTMPPS